MPLQQTSLQGRLQLGVSRGSPESVIRGFESFASYPAEGENEDMVRRHLDILPHAIEGEGMAPCARVAGTPPPSRAVAGLRPHLVGVQALIALAVWTAEGPKPHVFNPDAEDKAFL